MGSMLLSAFICDKKLLLIADVRIRTDGRWTIAFGSDDGRIKTEGDRAVAIAVM